MAQACWQAAADGRYRIDVVIGNHKLQAMVDLGLVDPLDLVGFELEPSIYDALINPGFLARNALGNRGMRVVNRPLRTADLRTPNYLTR